MKNFILTLIMSVAFINLSAADLYVNGSGNSGTYYTSLVNDFEDASANDISASTQFTDLKARRFDIMPLGRVTFTYYLK